MAGDSDTQWYYEAREGVQVGPVSPDEIHRLRTSGNIHSQTRVWKKGMTNWQTLAELDGAGGRGGTVSSPAPGGETRCAECYKLHPTEELLDYGDVKICVSCKPIVIEKLQLGMRIGHGAWRHGRFLVVEDQRELPQRCVKCNEPATRCYRRKLIWTPTWVNFTLLAILLGVGILLYLIFAMIFRRRATIDLYLCERHQKRRALMIAGAWMSFVACVVTFFFGLVTAWDVNGIGLGGFLMGVSALLLVTTLLLLVSMTIVRTVKIADGLAYLGGVSEAFRETFPRWHGS